LLSCRRNRPSKIIRGSATGWQAIQKRESHRMLQPLKTMFINIIIIKRIIATLIFISLRVPASIIFRNAHCEYTESSKLYGVTLSQCSILCDLT
jgi:hypothetical protein